MKLIKQNLGNKIALGISGTPEEIQARLDSMLNWGAIVHYKHSKHNFDGLHSGSPESFQYVMLSEEKLRDYFINLISLNFDIERLDMGSLPLLSYIRTQANSMLATIPEETFLDIGKGEKSEERESFYADAKAEVRELAAHPERE